MESEENNNIVEETENSDDSIVRLEKTRRLIIHKEITEIRLQLENSLKFERGVMIQNMTEKDFEIENTGNISINTPVITDQKCSS